ncbi:MAG: SRPBCC family protein [Candidatus Binataceae bacterium]
MEYSPSKGSLGNAPMIHVELTSVIKAPPARVYAILVDYHVDHPRILPRWFFKSVQVLKGGTGAGTEILVHTGIAGGYRKLRMTVAEPEPGRVLTETDIDTGVKTSFTVTPSAAAASAVTIATDWPQQRGLAGKYEAWMVPKLLRAVYRAELSQLASLASAENVTRSQPSGPSASSG